MKPSGVVSRFLNFLNTTAQCNHLFVPDIRKSPEKVEDRVLELLPLTYIMIYRCYREN